MIGLIILAMVMWCMSWYGYNWAKQLDWQSFKIILKHVAIGFVLAIFTGIAITTMVAIF